MQNTRTGGELRQRYARKMSRRPDEDAIRELSLSQVVDGLGLLEMNPKRKDRYRPTGYGGSYWIACDFSQGVWADHKHGGGGGPIDLMLATLAGAPDYEVDASRLPLAFERLAEHFNLWKESARERGRALAAALMARPQASAYSWIDETIKQVMEGSAGDAWAETCQLLDALGVDQERITLCGFQGALCWQPVVPWQGVEVSRREDGALGGWTKDRALEWSRDESALQILLFDFDGNGEKAPLEHLVVDLARELRLRDLPPAAVVWSTLQEDGTRAKAHFYFKSSSRAPDPETCLAWWDEIAQVINQIVAEWSELDEVERSTFRIDTCTRQIQRLVRLPGFAKFGKDTASVIAQARGATIDMVEWLETREQNLFVSGTLSQRWGKGSCHETLITDDGEKYVALARDVWPIAPYEILDNDDHGVLYRFLRGGKHVAYARMSAAAFTDRNGGRRAASEASARGVMVAVGKGGEFSHALGTWRSACARPPLMLVSSPGWHRDEHGWLYANGPRVHGSSAYRSDPQSDAAQSRKARRGELAKWHAQARRLITTPGLCVALATSLGGALLTRLGRGSFIINLCGDSSAGKTTALKLAASVWGDVQDVLRSWDSTRNALEGLASASNDACLPLDELQRFLSDAGGQEVSRAIHTLAGTTGRARMTRDATLKQVRYWRTSVVSSSETPIRDLVGESWRGGDGVRAVDLEIQQGEVTLNANHAVELATLTQEVAGIVGDDWVGWLTTQPDELLKETWEGWSNVLRDMDTGAEAGRVLDHLAVLATSMQLGEEARIIPTGLPWREAICDWAVARVHASREGADTPQERNLTTLIDATLEHPGYFPDETNAAAARECWGVIVKGSPPQCHMELWTTEGMLKKGPLKGHPVRSWLNRFCAQEGLAENRRGARCAGRQTSWWVFDLDEIQARSATATPSATPSETGGRTHEN